MATGRERPRILRSSILGDEASAATRVTRPRSEPFVVVGEPLAVGKRSHIFGIHEDTFEFIHLPVMSDRQIPLSSSAILEKNGAVTRYMSSSFQKDEEISRALYALE